MSSKGYVLRSHNAIFVTAWLIILLLIFTGTVFFHYVEKWNYVDSFYFTGITMATVGYGDISPKTDLGKISAVVFSFLSVTIALGSFSILAEGMLHRHHRKMRQMLGKR